MGWQSHRHHICAPSHVRASRRTFSDTFGPSRTDFASILRAHTRPLPIRDQCRLEIRWARRARVVSLAPIISLDLSRSDARGRSDLHSSKDAWTSRMHIRPGILQVLARHEVSVDASPSERRLSPRSDRWRGDSPADRRDWLAACDVMHRHSRSARRRACSAGRVTGRRRYSARIAKEGFEANSEAAGRRERTALMTGYGTVGPSSWHVGSTIGQLTPRP